MSGHINTIILIAALILFAIYRRISRNIGWQLLVPRKIIVRTAILSFFGLSFLAAGVTRPISLISDIIGILIGLSLAYYSGASTRYEERGGQMYYRPNTWVGFFVIAVFLGRLIARIYNLYVMGKTMNFQQGQPADYEAMKYMAGSSWTAGLLLIMFSYYVIYYILLLKNQKNMGKTQEL